MLPIINSIRKKTKNICCTRQQHSCVQFYLLLIFRSANFDNNAAENNTYDLINKTNFWNIKAICLVLAPFNVHDCVG